MHRHASQPQIRRLSALRHYATSHRVPRCAQPLAVWPCEVLMPQQQGYTIDRTVELLGPSQSFTGFQLASKCLNPMMDYLGRGMDATAYTLPTFMRFDAKMLNAVAMDSYRTGRGMAHRWHGPPRKRRVGASEGKAQDSQETWRVGPHRCNVKMPRGKSRLRIDCFWRGLGKADA